MCYHCLRSWYSARHPCQLDHLALSLLMIGRDRNQGVYAESIHTKNLLGIIRSQRCRPLSTPYPWLTVLCASVALGGWANFWDDETSAMYVTDVNRSKQSNLLVATKVPQYLVLRFTEHSTWCTNPEKEWRSVGTYHMTDLIVPTCSPCIPCMTGSRCD